MPGSTTLRRLSLLALVLLTASGCASKYARFRYIAVAETNPKTVFETTETVLRRYFAEMIAREPDHGLLTTERSRVAFGDLPKDQHSIFATAMVEPRDSGCTVRLKVQRTKIVGRWTWLGLGSTFYEKEVFSGEDAPLTDKIQADLLAELGAVELPAEQPPATEPAPEPVAPTAEEQGPPAPVQK